VSVYADAVIKSWLQRRVTIGRFRPVVSLGGRPRLFVGQRSIHIGALKKNFTYPG
jgi:hypothetical protein